MASTCASKALDGAGCQERSDGVTLVRLERWCHGPKGLDMDKVSTQKYLHLFKYMSRGRIRNTCMSYYKHLTYISKYTSFFSS